MPANHSDLEKRLWDAADELRANSKLKSSEYSIPVLGVIFLRYADHKFAEAEKKMPQQASGRRSIHPASPQHCDDNRVFRSSPCRLRRSEE